MDNPKECLPLRTRQYLGAPRFVRIAPATQPLSHVAKPLKNCSSGLAEFCALGFPEEFLGRGGGRLCLDAYATMLFFVQPNESATVSAVLPRTAIAFMYSASDIAYQSKASNKPCVYSKHVMHLSSVVALPFGRQLWVLV